MIKAKFNKLIDSPQPVLIDFYADWCGPSHLLSPMLDKLRKELGTGKILKINVETNGDLVDKLDVQSIPTLMIFQNGELKWRGNGLQSLPALKEKLLSLAG